MSAGITVRGEHELRRQPERSNRDPRVRRLGRAPDPHGDHPRVARDRTRQEAVGVARTTAQDDADAAG